jgi:predicted RNA-binding Zn-ribbon protein involved in translation (DUF1610 family)
MSKAMECPRCGELELREIDCNVHDNEVCTEYECDECGHYECDWRKAA